MICEAQRQLHIRSLPKGVEGFVQVMGMHVAIELLLIRVCNGATTINRMYPQKNLLCGIPVHKVIRQTEI